MRGSRLAVRCITTTSSTISQDQDRELRHTKRERIVLAAGRPDMTDPLFDWIVEMTQQQRTVKGEVESRHFAHIKKSRACKPFRLENPSQERFWRAVEKASQ